MLKLIAAGILFAATGHPTTAYSQNYPTRPITLILPYLAGGVTDVAARLIAKPMSELLGQQVLVENRPGASGSVGATEAARAEPDGYTIFYGSSGNLAINPITMPDLKYDPQKDFTPIQAVWESPLVLVINPTMPYKTFDEFVAHAKANPKAISFGSAGTGSNGHLAGEQFQDAAGVELSHVPYKGTSQEVIDLVAGRIGASFEYSTVVKKYVDSGELIALATTGGSRMASFPDTPTMEELGYPSATTSSWSGVLVPAGTPEPIVEKLKDVMSNVLELPEIISFYEGNGSISLKEMQGEKFRQFIADQTERYREVITSKNITFN